MTPTFKSSVPYDDKKYKWVKKPTWFSDEVDKLLRAEQTESIEAVEFDLMYLAARAIFCAKRTSIRLLSPRIEISSPSSLEFEIGPSSWSESVCKII